jgi:hypothetical protein
MRVFRLTMILIVSLVPIAPAAAQFGRVRTGAAPKEASGYEVAVFPSNVVDPATARPMAATVVYPLGAVTCDQIFAAEATAPIIDPTEARFTDPKHPTRDCVIDITRQVATLPAGSYRMTARATGGGRAGDWFDVSSVFSSSGSGGR